MATYDNPVNQLLNDRRYSGRGYGAPSSMNSSFIDLAMKYSNQTTGALVATEGQGFVGGNNFVTQTSCTSIFLTNNIQDGTTSNASQQLQMAAKQASFIVIFLTATPTTRLEFKVKSYALTTPGAAGFATFTVTDAFGSSAAPFADTNAVTFRFMLA